MSEPVFYSLLGLALLSLGLTGWQWLAALRFPLHQRGPTPKRLPSVTLLKPLKGLDGETAEALRSWFQQDYPAPVQILFGVASPDDPVCPLVRNLIAEHPRANAQLVICEPLLGANAKVSTLAHLQPLATGEVLVISDADVKAPADFLPQVVAPLDRPEVGLVNCFYILADPSTLALR